MVSSQSSRCVVSEMFGLTCGRDTLMEEGLTGRIFVVRVVV